MHNTKSIKFILSCLYLLITIFFLLNITNKSIISTKQSSIKAEEVENNQSVPEVMVSQFNVTIILALYILALIYSNFKLLSILVSLLVNKKFEFSHFKKTHSVKFIKQILQPKVKNKTYKLKNAPYLQKTKGLLLKY